MLTSRDHLWLPIGDTTVLVRPVRLDSDVTQLTDLLHRAYKQLADLGFQYVASFQDGAVTRSRASKGLCLVAVVDTRLVGTITLCDAVHTGGCPWYDRPDVGHFGQFAVDPSVQSHGLGSRLLDIVEKRAAECGLRELALNTAERAVHLIEFYERRGYRFIERVDWGVNYSSVILSKTLTQPPPTQGNA
jgi:GNAT superfamily N-acetyltransferase